MDNIYYRDWKLNFLEYLDSVHLNYGLIGEDITCIDDTGRKIGSINLEYAWKHHYTYIEMINVLTGIMELR